MALRTAQTWIEKGFVETVRGGSRSGDKRYLDIIGCMEIGVVKELRQRHNLEFKDIGQIMDDLRRGCPLTLKRAFFSDYEKPILVIRSYVEHLEDTRTPLRGHCFVADEGKEYRLWGPREGKDLGDRIEGETREFKDFWKDCTFPDPRKLTDTKIINLAVVIDKVLGQLA